MFAQMGANYGNLYNQQNQQMANIAQLYQDRGMDRYGLGLKMEEMKYLPQEMQLAILNQAMRVPTLSDWSANWPWLPQ